MKSPPAQARRLVYLGTPAIAVPPLHALADAGFDIPLVVTNQDKRRGRGNELTPSPVKKAAAKLGIPVAHRTTAALDVDADLGVVVAFGRLIRPEVLDALPMVNIHFSLLPRWRGAAPVERAILAGDRETGVCLMELAYELDSGGIYERAVVPISPTATVETLRAELVAVASKLLVAGLKTGLGDAVPQQGEITWAAKIEPSDLELDFTGSAVQAERLTRVGRAFTFFRGRRLVVHQAAIHPTAGHEAGLPAPQVTGEALLPAGLGQLTGTLVGTADGVLELVRVQPEGKAVMDASAWANGARLGPEETLGR